MWRGISEKYVDRLERRRKEKIEYNQKYAKAHKDLEEKFDRCSNQIKYINEYEARVKLRTVEY